MSDEDLLILSQSRPGVFEVLVNRYKEPFLRKAKSILGDIPEIDDVVSETFVKMYMHGKTYTLREGIPFSAWAYKILINTCLTLYRKRKREWSHTALLSEELEALLVDEHARGEHEKKLSVDVVLSYLSKLPSILRETVELHALLDLSYKDIAEKLNISEGLVRARMHRAKKEIQKNLTQHAL